MGSVRDLVERSKAVATNTLGELRRNWRLLMAAVLAVGAVLLAIDVSDRQGRMDIPQGYAVRMVCEPDPESHLWNGGCERIAADISRSDKPSIVELYQAFVTVHHTQIPSPELERQFRSDPCEQGFDLDTQLKGTRYVFVPLRPHFSGACSRAQVETIMAMLDDRDRALLAIEREGLSHAALYAGALANLTEPLVILGAAAVVAALFIL
ncbi:hypothetical protein [Hyphomicrobium sp. D-2]|uniref:hypothetical protein n=1 Tax=Hyphomicrobium sp. D-2 TaxID=3041621 RepID=UPI0024576271|nr:hypothetical protein [Hyphomicrobium sp. D-2]MDH4982071.1 hypothetical protein [Hyphomicrobium sp. D-2]